MGSRDTPPSHTKRWGPPGPGAIAYRPVASVTSASSLVEPWYSLQSIGGYHPSGAHIPIVDPSPLRCPQLGSSSIAVCGVVTTRLLPPCRRRTRCWLRRNVTMNAVRMDLCAQLYADPLRCLMLRSRVRLSRLPPLLIELRALLYCSRSSPG